MNDLPEKIGLLTMILLLILIILLSSFNFDNINLEDSTRKQLLNNSNIFINESILNESPLNDTFNDSTKYSIYIQDINNNNAILDLNSDETYSSPIIKNLLLNLAILDKYNSNSKLNITVYTNGQIINGSLYGDLILVPEGNINSLKLSLLNFDSEFKNLSKQIKDYGINQINGDILVDIGNYNLTNNLTLLISPSSNGELANVKLINNITKFNIVSNVLTINETVNKSIDIITNNSTIILNGSISNKSKEISLNIPVNNTNIKESFISALNNESIFINKTNIDYEKIYENLLIKNNLISGNLTNFTVNTTKVEVKNSTLFINISFNNNSSLKYMDYNKIAFLETKPSIESLFQNLTKFNESKNYDNLIYFLNNNSNGSFENGLKNLNEFLSKNNINSNYMLEEDYEKSLINPKLSNNLLTYIYTQKYFNNIYNNMSSLNGINGIKVLNNSLIYYNDSSMMLNQTIIGYMDVKSSKLAFSIYLYNVNVSSNTSKKVMDDTISLLEKVYEKYN